jgi:hypothetical protein
MGKFRINIIIIFWFNLLINNFKNPFWFPKLLIQFHVFTFFFCFFLLDLRHILWEGIECRKIWIHLDIILWLKCFEYIWLIWWGIVVVCVFKLFELFKSFEDLILLWELLLIYIHSKLLLSSNIFLFPLLVNLLFTLRILPHFLFQFHFLLFLIFRILLFIHIIIGEIIKAWIYFPLTLL